MRDGMVECKACRFWLQYINGEQEDRPRLMDIGLCIQVRSVNWLSRTHRNDYCEHGEFEEK
jgi:hypothetical protein